MSIENSTRVLRAVSYIEFGIRIIDKKTYINAWSRDYALFMLRNARTLLKNIKNDDRKERESVRLLKRLCELKEN